MSRLPLKKRGTLLLRTKEGRRGRLKTKESHNPTVRQPLFHMPSFSNPVSSQSVAASSLSDAPSGLCAPPSPNSVLLVTLSIWPSVNVAGDWVMGLLCGWSGGSGVSEWIAKAGTYLRGEQCWAVRLGYIQHKPFPAPVVQVRKRGRKMSESPV